MISVILQWQPPAQPNGIITAYKIIAISTQQTVILKSSTTRYKFCGLQPGQQVNYTISASTVAGEGPVASVSTRTTEQGARLHIVTTLIIRLHAFHSILRC